jgi:hypothetical protein
VVDVVDVETAVIAQHDSMHPDRYVAVANLGVSYGINSAPRAIWLRLPSMGVQFVEAVIVDSGEAIDADGMLAVELD